MSRDRLTIARRAIVRCAIARHPFTTCSAPRELFIMTSLRLKRVLITGGARGIGKALAHGFGRAGAELVLTDIDEAALAEARDELEAVGVRCLTYLMDVTDPASIAIARDQLRNDAGSIDILVNNAGIVFGGPFLDVPLEKHLRTYRINVEGTVAVTHAFLPDIEAASRGHLVFIASASGFVGLPNGSTYASSKWAAIGFAESMRAELDHRGVDNVGVTTVCPGYVDTGLFEGVTPPKTTRLLTPEVLAEKVVKAVERNQVWVLEPWIIKVTPFLKHALPTRVSDYLGEAFGANKSMDDWTGHSPQSTDGRDPQS